MTGRTSSVSTVAPNSPPAIAIAIGPQKVLGISGSIPRIAAAAILGMLPLMPSTFWGPLAIAIAGGLFGATVLTLLVLPVMYAAWFKVQPEKEGIPQHSTNN